MGDANTCGIKERFRKISCKAAECVGSYWAFSLSILFIAVWAATGPIFHFSDTWQLVINTGTTIVTFLMVFLIQATQSRDTLAIHIKLDELLRAIEPARTEIAAAEELPQKELDRLHEEMREEAQREQ